MKILLEPAVVLHTRPYRDTSVMADVLTEHHGKIRIIAHGVRTKKSRISGLLRPFLPLLISCTTKTELFTTQHIETYGAPYELKQDALLSGLYLNELLVKLLPTHEPHPELYQVYLNTLLALSGTEHMEIALRLFEKKLLISLGYGLQLDHTIKNQAILEDAKYTFEFGSGFSLSNANSLANFSGKSLLALHHDTLSTSIELQDSKRLLRGVIAQLLGNKQLKSRDLFINPRK